MSLHRDYEDYHSYSDFSFEEEESPERLNHRRQCRKKLEERLERKRLKQEFDELDGDFDWDELDK